MLEEEKGKLAQYSCVSIVKLKLENRSFVHFVN